MKCKVRAYIRFRKCKEVQEMKRLIAMVLVSMFGFASGCGGAPAPEPATPEEEAMKEIEGMTGEDTESGATQEAAPEEGQAATGGQEGIE